MNVNHLSGLLKSDRAIQPTTTNLKAGQMISGRVQELYPNNRALISIGNQQIVAQLETSLSAKQSYLFQVLSTGDITKLKVLTEQTGGNNAQLEAMLKQLGINVPKEARSFIQSLINQNIAFTPNQSKEMLSLLQQYGNSNETKAQIMEMMSKGLPITREVFNSLTSLKEGQLGDKLQMVANSLSTSSASTSVEQLLRERLAPFLTNSNNTMLNVMQKMNNNQPTELFTLFQKAALIPPNMSQAEFTSSIRRGLTQTNGALPFNTTPERVMEALSNLAEKQNVLLKDSQLNNVINRLSTNINQPERINEWKQFIIQMNIDTKVKPMLSQNENAQLTNWIQNKTSTVTENQQIINMLTNLQQKQTTPVESGMMRALILANDQQTLQAPFPVKHQFLALLKEFIQVSGLNDEVILATPSKETPQPTEFSMKQLLMQGMAQSSEVGNDRMMQLLSTLTGMQLQNIQAEMNNPNLQLVIPGEKLGLPNDMFMEFEGYKKNENGEIDADYCKILFHLELSNIGETVIQMAVQNRVVNIAIYNNAIEELGLEESNKALLKTALSNLDYHLSSVSFKKINEEETLPQKNKVSHENFSEGFDFRV
ncbi:hypothetical protein [Saliterribacillus persicus]|uniref:Uncharacterized protein n=1 Tax=Saliterribacillus persicus TaxID=930114 RepID=A0A368XRZ7_9BACI|nr:hypothetical protein [Saliterribacillus persicus]RCW70733.1 hypothetical protein DFR57_106130 [Saliterribacillus persicus]